MKISDRVVVSQRPFDRDETLSVIDVVSGIVEILNNSSSSRVITLPHNSEMVSSGVFASGDTTELIIWNKGAQNLQISANPNSIADFIVGDPFVFAGNFRIIKLVIGYTSGVMGIFCM